MRQHKQFGQPTNQPTATPRCEPRLVVNIISKERIILVLVLVWFGSVLWYGNGRRAAGGRGVEQKITRPLCLLTFGSERRNASSGVLPLLRTSFGLNQCHDC